VFFTVYSGAVGTQIDNLPSNAGHCGVCHFDFDGGGALNPYGLDMDAGLDGGMSDEEAILAIEALDSDGDGHTSLVEITDTLSFSNTPTFPGLNVSNIGHTVHVAVEDIDPHLVPFSQTDTIPPAVAVNLPNGGEHVSANSYYSIGYNATDENGISHVNIYLSDDGGVTFIPMAINTTPGTGYSWYVPNLPTGSGRVAVEAVDNAGNVASDTSDADFTLVQAPPGHVPWTLRDNRMPGSQMLDIGGLHDPDFICALCHGFYDETVAPWDNWRGSMMGQAMRDPLFLACMAVAEQDAPGVGEICIRCHSPRAWLGGRAFDSSGGLLDAADRHGVECDFCHRMVDRNYVAGVSPPEDEAVLAGISPLPLQYGNGQFIEDSSTLQRGPYADSHSMHAFADSPFHRSGDLCGVCHDVSNPAFTETGPRQYAVDPFNQAHPDADSRNMFPIERTFSEWSVSEYAVSGVYAPQFAGNKADGIVSTCQDCHMHDINARGSNDSRLPARSDLPLHDLTGGNTFVPDLIADFYPGEVYTSQLDSAKVRARGMLQKAATLEVTSGYAEITVRVTNETGHKLPSGYPEGRRIWLNVKAFDNLGQLVFESGEYNFDTAELIPDAQAKVYEVHPGLSSSLAGILGLPAGKSFHFVLCDTIYLDNRIPPRGFTNADFETIQSPPIEYAYADGQHWDDTQYNLPVEAESVLVTLYYQTTTKEFVEFLRDENTTTSDGQDMYNSWATHGKSAPEVMAQVSATVTGISGVDGPGSTSALIYSLNQNSPNPFGPATEIAYTLAGREHVNISVYDLRGRRVKGLVDEIQEPSRYRILWDGTNDRGEDLPPGVYFVRYSAGPHVFSKKALLVR
jgi:hypothetical protein